MQNRGAFVQLAQNPGSPAPKHLPLALNPVIFLGAFVQLAQSPGAWLQILEVNELGIEPCPKSSNPEPKPGKGMGIKGLGFQP